MDIEISVCRIIGVERQAEQTALAAPTRAEMSRNGVGRIVSLTNPNLSRLLNDEQTTSAVSGIRDGGRFCKTGCNLPQFERCKETGSLNRGRRKTRRIRIDSFSRRSKQR
jgi:hypothetical protein